MNLYGTGEGGTLQAGDIIISLKDVVGDTGQKLVAPKGQEVDPATYPDLAAALGYEGGSNPNLPDLSNDARDFKIVQENKENAGTTPDFPTGPTLAAIWETATDVNAVISEDGTEVDGNTTIGVRVGSAYSIDLQGTTGKHVFELEYLTNHLPADASVRVGLGGSNDQDRPDNLADYLLVGGTGLRTNLGGFSIDSSSSPGNVAVGGLDAFVVDFDAGTVEVFRNNVSYMQATFSGLAALYVLAGTTNGADNYHVKLRTNESRDGHTYGVL